MYHPPLMQITSMEDQWKKSMGHWIAKSHLQTLSNETIFPALSITQGAGCKNDIQFEFQIFDDEYHCNSFPKSGLTTV